MLVFVIMEITILVLVTVWMISLVIGDAQYLLFLHTIGLFVLPIDL